MSFGFSNKVFDLRSLSGDIIGEETKKGIGIELIRDHFFRGGRPISLTTLSVIAFSKAALSSSIICWEGLPRLAFTTGLSCNIPIRERMSRWGRGRISIIVPVSLIMALALLWSEYLSLMGLGMVSWPWEVMEAM
ncbi:MAG: hypothetical protein UX91_C0012G0011 [Candidatus Amesbacteria bacterium GW2011_GWB1_47_19]|nr:MAG: hypothetical protein UW51_C0011G0011 [Candidatus Amesbacteria bacterium GW2011_GWA1_44_24]KKU66500.1 MAG: hypothetical protein UX91_C0012G0011 [Candidatus Amesbacteria bacterium GW2011_GWB1_47_19]